jgi:hypothetical protein
VPLRHRGRRPVGGVDVAQVDEGGHLHPTPFDAGHDKSVVAEVAMVVLVVVGVAGVLPPQLALVQPDVVEIEDLTGDRQEARVGNEPIELRRRPREIDQAGERVVGVALSGRRSSPAASEVSKTPLRKSRPSVVNTSGPARIHRCRTSRVARGQHIAILAPSGPTFPTVDVADGAASGSGCRFSPT